MSTNEFTSSGSAGTSAEGFRTQAETLGRDLKDKATDLGRSAQDVVQTQAANLTVAAKDMASDAGEKLRATVSEQKAFGADYVGNVAGIIRRTASEFDSEIPQAGHYIRKAASQLDTVSDSLRNKDVGEIVANVQDFARKQPTAFLGASVLLGFAVVRFLKSGTGSAGGTTTAGGLPRVSNLSQQGAPKAGM